MDTALHQLSNVAGRILGADDAIRREAEQVFENMKSNPTLFFVSLTRLMSVGDTLVRVFAAIMLRQNLMPRFKEWDSIEATTRDTIRDELVQCFTAETLHPMRRKIADVIAALAARILGKLSIEETPQAWPSLMPMVMNGMSYDDPVVQEASYDLLAKLAEYCPAILISHLEAIYYSILKVLQSPNANTRVSGAKAALQIFISIYDMPEVSAAVKSYSGLLETILQRVVRVAYNDRDENTLEAICQSFQDVVRLSPGFFRGNLEEVISIFSEIARKTDIFDPALCRSAFTFLISYGTAAKLTARKSPTYTPTILTLLFTYLRVVNHNDAWTQNDQSDTFLNDEEDNDFHEYARSIICQIATALGPKDLLAKVSTPALTQCTSQDWCSQLAGLTIFSELSESCVKSMVKHLPALSKIITSLLSAPIADVHPRVRFAALNLFASLATDQGRRFALTNTPMLALLLDHLDHTRYFPRIVSWTCLCIVDFSSSLTATSVEKYAQALLERAVILLGLNSLGISNNALCLISAIAAVIGPNFARYYDNIMPGLVGILQTISPTTPDPASRDLRGKAIECIGLIASAVGSDVFGRDIEAVMTLLLPGGSVIERSEEGLPTAYTRNEYTLRALESIAGCMGAGFARYLPVVIPPLLEMAGTEDIFRQFDLTEDGQPLRADTTEIESLEKAGFTSMVLNIRGHGMRKACVNTTLMQEKITACELLSLFAVDMKIAFVPYLKASADILLPLCGYRTNPRVRTAAVGSVAALVDVAVSSFADKDIATLRTFWDASLDALCKAADCETVDGLSTILLSMGSALDVLPFSISADQLDTISSFVSVASQEAMVRKTNRAAEGTPTEDTVEDDEDAELSSSAESNDNTILEAASVLNTSLVKNDRETYMPIFNQRLAQVYYQMLDNAGTDDFVKMTALISFADVIENGGPAAGQYCERLIPAFLANAAAPGHQLRRGACFGLKAIIQQTGSAFAPFARTAIEACVKASQYRDENDVEDCEGATDNALATLGKLLDNFGTRSAFPLPELTIETENQLKGMYIALLPRQYDEDEDEEIHARFLAWVMQDPVLAANPASKVKALEIVNLAKVDESIVSNETLQALTQFSQ